jgi:hypothetical protein
VQSEVITRAELVRVPMGRSRALAIVGGTLFSLVLQATAPKIARASHLPVPYPCYGYKQCHCCSGGVCCESGCTSLSGNCLSSGQCWYTCDCQNTYQCCDFQGGANTSPCICSYIVSICHPPC